MDRRKELKEQYKQMKPDMGILQIRSKTERKCHLIPSKNLKGQTNSTRFQLEMGSFMNRELQKAWNEQGADAFEIQVLDQLEYNKDESKSDYTEDLAALADIWKEKLAEQDYSFYRR